MKISIWEYVRANGETHRAVVIADTMEQALETLSFSFGNIHKASLKEYRGEFTPLGEANASYTSPKVVMFENLGDLSQWNEKGSKLTLCGVYDNRVTMCRERYDEEGFVSSLPCDDGMRNNKFFPWGCFEDVPRT